MQCGSLEVYGYEDNRMIFIIIWILWTNGFLGTHNGRPVLCAG